MMMRFHVNDIDHVDDVDHVDDDAVPSVHTPGHRVVDERSSKVNNNNNNNNYLKLRSPGTPRTICEHSKPHKLSSTT